MANVPFSEKNITASFDGAFDVTSADVDGDGDIDILGAAVTDDKITWWENTSGDGSTWTQNDITTNFNGAWDVASADVDGDGDIDILGAASNDDTITWWENTSGDGSTWTQNDITTNFNGARSVASAYVDGDKHIDILGAAGGDDKITWWENTNGDGSTWTQNDITTGFDLAYDVASADVDGDGDIDILGAALYDDKITWWENTSGDGSTWTQNDITASFDGARSVASADVDGDGDIDILGAALYDDKITWWENTSGDGSTWTQNDITTSFNGARGVASADVDGDGDIDILGAALYDDKITWWENTSGDGSTWTQNDITASFNGATSVSSADVDGDGFIDILGAAYSDDKITWWENETVLTATISNYTPVIYETAVDFGDAVSLDGSNDSIRISHADELDFSANSFTVEAWVYHDPNSGTDYRNIVSKKSQGGIFAGWTLRLDNNDIPQFFLADGTNRVDLGDSTVTTPITRGEWHHLAGVVDSDSGEVRLYVDGELVDTDNTIGDISSGSSTDLVIGGWSSADSDYWQGKIDEVRIWNTARTKTEIQDNLYQKLDASEEDLVAYYNFNEDSVDGNAVSDITENGNNGTLNNGDDTNFVDSEIPTFKGHVDIELSHKVANQPGIILNYQIESDSTATQDEDYYNSQTDVSTTDEEPQTDSIFIAEGEDSARIYLTALPDAVVEGDENIKLTLLPDFNKALDLDGVDDYVELPSVIDPGSGNAFTAELWFKLDTTVNSNKVLLQQQDGTGTGRSWLSYQSSSGKLRSYLGGSNLLSENTVTTGVWHHAAVVYNGTTLYLYLNGNEVASNNRTLESSDGELILGNNKTFNNPLDGEIDEVRIWDIALTKDEINDIRYVTLSGSEDNLVAHYNFNDDSVDGTTIYDSSANSNNGTLVGENQVLSLDGSGDYVEVGNPDELKFGTESFTVEAWVYDDPSSGLTDYNNVVSKKAGGETTSGWTLRINDSDIPQFFLADGSNRVNVNYDTAITEGEWHHLAGVVDRTDNEARLYLNGELVATESIANLGGFSSDDNLIIGSWDVDSNQDYWQGEIDEVRIWNTALTEDEIQDNLDKKLVGTEDGLVAYYNFEDSTADDNSSNANNGSFNGNATTTVDNDVPVNDLTDSLASDPFATNGATYGIETSQSAEITIQDTDNYVVDIAVANEFAEDLSDTTNFVVVDDSGNATFQVKLTSEPTEDVTVSISIDNVNINNDLTFQASDWDSYQSITVSSISDGSNINLTISGGNYNNTTKSLAVSTQNNDEVTILKLTEGGAELELTPTVSITATSDATEGNETESGVFTISLDTPAPEGGLLIPVSVSSTATEGTDYNFYADSFTYSGESALSLDGVDDYVAIGNVLPNAYTKEAWIKLGSGNGAKNIISSGDNTTTHAFYVPSNNQLASGHNGAWTTVQDNEALEEGVWYHVAVTYDGSSEMKLYKNGILVNSATGVSPLGDNISTNIGKHNTGNYFPGEIDEVRIWETAKTESEIQENLYTKLAGTEEGLVAYYNFDDATTIIPDVTENGNDGTPYIGQGLSFDGVDDYVELPSVIDPGSANAFSAELWFKLDTTVNSYEGLLQQQNGSGTGRSWLFYQNSSGKLGSFLGGSNLLSENTVTTGVWHHAAVVYDGTTLYLYLNGNQEASNNRTLESSDGELILGNIKDLTNSLYGQIDEVRIWNTARSKTEIQDNLYKKLEGTEDGLAAYYNFDSDIDTTINDLTGNGFDGTLVNGDSSNLTTSDIGYTLTDWEVTKTPVVKIAEGETEATITVSKVDNETVESDDETVTVTLEDWANYDLNSDTSLQSATVTLNDDDEAGIEFAKLDTLGSVDNIAQEFIVSTAYDASNGTVGITLNNGNNSYTFAQGTELTFDGGAVVTVDSQTTIAATGETLVNVTFTQDSATDEITAEEISEIELVNIELSSFAETDTGRIAIFDVSLAQTPTEDVTVTLTDANGTATATVTFTTSDWDTSQFVRMIVDEDTTDSSFDIQVNTTTANQQDTNYGDRTFDAPISTKTVSTSLEFYNNTLVTSEVATIALEVTSDYANGTVGLKLDSGADSYTLTAGTELSFSDGAIVTVDSDTTISTDDAGTSVAVTFTADSGSSAITTDETADIELSGEDTTTFAVRLSSQPSDTVTLNLDIGDTTEGAFASSASSQTLTFTSDNWDTYQEVTLYGVDDSEDDDNVEYSIGVTASSNDSNYNEITDSITVTNQDNDELIEEVNDTSNSSDIVASLSLVDNGEITEGSTGQLQVTLSEAAPAGGLKVRYAVSGGTATPDEDFVDLQGFVERAYDSDENPLSQAHIGVFDFEDTLEDFKLVDLDSDGDLDAVLIRESTTHYYRNNGNSSFSEFEELTGTDNPFDSISGESIAFGDLNGDTKLDVLLLDENGDISYYENTTENASDTPSFTLNSTVIYDNTNDEIQINQITLVNIDGDENGYLELFASLNDGTISYYEQTNTTPTFVDNINPNPLSSFDSIGEVVPNFVDYDSDGDIDVLIGMSVDFTYYENTGDANNPNFIERTGNDNPFNSLTSNYIDDSSHPYLTDIDNDGDVDAFIAYQSSDPQIQIGYYENTFFQEVEIAGGATTANIDITTIADNIAEDDKTIEVSLSAKPSQSHTLKVTRGWIDGAFDIGTIELQIIDSDTEVVGLSSGTELTFEDDNGNQVVFTVYDSVSVFSQTPTIVNGTVESGANTAVIAVDETTDFTDEGYRLDESDTTPFTSTVSIIDDDVAGITISGDTDGSTTITTSETDAGDSSQDKTFNIVLDTKPTDDKNVAVYVGVENSEEGLLSDADETNENLVKLVFTPDNWDTSQQVTLSSVDDEIDDGDVSYNIITTVISDDKFYHEDSVSLIVENDFDSSTDNSISLSIDDLGLSKAYLSAETQIGFSNGAVFTIDETTSVYNNKFADVNLTLDTIASQIDAGTTVTTTDTNNNTVELIVATAYDGENGTIGTIGLQAASEKVYVPKDTPMYFSNGASGTFTLDEPWLFATFDTDSFVGLLSKLKIMTYPTLVFKQ